MARLAPGVDIRQAERAMDRVYQQLLAEAVRQAPSLRAGVHLALGATRPAIYRLMLKEVALLTAAGCAFGIAAFMASNRILSSLLFELTSSDPASLVLATVVLAGITLLAGYLPARRAAGLDPDCTLRLD
jgi:predicted lysophospholipase L1 biosynthesis ABC-type transport system permease subunit